MPKSTRAHRVETLTLRARECVDGIAGLVGGGLGGAGRVIFVCAPPTQRYEEIEGLIS